MPVSVLYSPWVDTYLVTIICLDMSDTESVKVETNEDEIDVIKRKDEEDEEAEELLTNGSNNKVLYLLNGQDS